jgi:Amt family ammonium transporter
MKSSSVYEACKATLTPIDSTNASIDDTLALQTQLLQCISSSNANSIDTFFLIYASSLVFFMQAGFASLCAGSVQKKNVQNTMLKNLLDAAGAALSFYAVGFGFAYGGSFDEDKKGKTTFIGNGNFFLMGLEDVMFWMFQFAFAATVSGFYFVMGI